MLATSYVCAFLGACLFAREGSIIRTNAFPVTLMRVELLLEAFGLATGIGALCCAGRAHRRLAFGGIAASAIMGLLSLLAPTLLH